MKTEKKLKWRIMGAGIITRKMADALELPSLNQLYAIASKILKEPEHLQMNSKLDIR